MTDEQYIQVMELWGWKLIEGDWYQPTPNTDWPKGLKVCTAAGIKSEVNSWSGFGRTVEAMAEKDKYLYINDKWDLCFYDGPFSVNEDGSDLLTFAKEDLNSMIQATHLAALESIDARSS